jgi:hypothetical protein
MLSPIISRCAPLANAQSKWPAVNGSCAMCAQLLSLATHRRGGGSVRSAHARGPDTGRSPRALALRRTSAGASLRSTHRPLSRQLSEVLSSSAALTGAGALANVGCSVESKHASKHPSTIVVATSAPQSQKRAKDGRREAYAAPDVRAPDVRGAAGAQALLGGSSTRYLLKRVRGRTGLGNRRGFLARFWRRAKQARN